MKKLFMSTLIVMVVLLTACGSSSTGTPANTTKNELPTATQLALGSLKLEDSENAITAEQAVELLPMWQVYEDLLSSDTAAQEEIDALAEQIQETMTSEQMQAITNMQLTQQDMFTTMQGVNVSTSTSQSNSTITVPSGGGGGMPAGGPPDGGGGAPPDMGGDIPSDFGGGGATSSTGTGKTDNAGSGSSAVRIAGVPSALVQVLIQILQQKVAA